MLLWIVLAVALVAAFAVTVVFTIALCRIAKRADEVLEAQLERSRFAAGLNHLSGLRSPTGRRFFPRSDSRRELTEAVEEVLDAEPVTTGSRER